MHTQLYRSISFFSSLPYFLMPNDIEWMKHRANVVCDSMESGLHESLLNIILYVNIKCDLKARINSSQAYVGVCVCVGLPVPPTHFSTHSKCTGLLTRYCWHNLCIFDVPVCVGWRYSKCIFLNRFVANGFHLLVANKCSSLHSKVHLIRRFECSSTADNTVSNTLTDYRYHWTYAIDYIRLFTAMQSGFDYMQIRRKEFTLALALYSVHCTL